jgi:hypothetical protein
VASRVADELAESCMGAQIELVKGNMFDGPSDLVVIPCSTVPTITWFVADHLRSFGIPEPKDKMKPGDVLFTDLRRANNIAQFAAYVASVIPSRSTPPRDHLLPKMSGLVRSRVRFLGLAQVEWSQRKRHAP